MATLDLNKLLQRLGSARVVGPVILGLAAPAYAVQRYASEDEIFNMISVAVAQASLRSRKQKTGVKIPADKVSNL